ncbi:MAG TPA: hypothetical protein VMW83_12730 [Spirochaetia bacterium]|nr:hypothetical protein [Spirochaetia bacterium]
MAEYLLGLTFSKAYDIQKHLDYLVGAQGWVRRTILHLLSPFSNLVHSHLRLNVYVQKQLVELFPGDFVAAHKVQHGVIDPDVEALLQFGMCLASISRLNQMTYGGFESSVAREKDALMLPQPISIELGHIGERVKTACVIVAREIPNRDQVPDDAALRPSRESLAQSLHVENRSPSKQAS